MKSQNKVANGYGCVFYPFAVLMYFISIYKLLILCRQPVQSGSVNNKSIFSSVFTTLLSITILNVAHAKKNNFLKCLHRYKIAKTGETARKYSIKKLLIFITLSVCFFIPFLFSASIAIALTYSEMPEYFDFWLMGHASQERGDTETFGVLLCSFAYSAQQIWVPTIVLLLYCNLTLTLADNLEMVKMNLKMNMVSSLAQQSQAHKMAQLRVRQHEEIFSFLIFLVLCMIVMIGFTGLALGMEGHDSNRSVFMLEGASYLYFSIIGLVSLTYSATRIPLQLQDICEIYRHAYDSIIETESSLQNSTEDRRRKVFKNIYSREIIYLTAWDIIRLDKNLAFSVLGGLLTYGFLILQLKKD